jgi:monovalent cation/hydrogen antiporter
VHESELVLALLVPVAALAVLARRLGVPYPILLVIGGLLLGLVPGLPRVELEPDTVFLLFLPPMLYIAGFFTSIRDFRANARPIGSLAVGLVLATIVVVGAVAHAVVPGLSWPAAFLLATIVSPPDAIAATTVLQRLGAPRRLVAILEGESLLNDATALTAYRAALAAVVVGTFSPADTGLRFLLALGGVPIGLAVGWAIAHVRRRLNDPPVEIVISLLTPYAAYLPAEELGFSGVLATVAAALYLSRRQAELMEPQTRLSGRAVWETLVFVLTGLVFILIGLQLPGVIEHLGQESLGSLLGSAAAVSLAAIAVRFVWIYLTQYLPHPIMHGHDDPHPPPRELFVASWAGMRGVVSLAAALALPRTLADGSPFAERDLLVFLTFGVILVTLVGQGLTLPLVMRWLHVGADGADEAAEEQRARSAAAQAAVARIEELAEEWPGHLPLVDALRAQYGHRLSHLGEHDADGPGAAADPAQEQELLEHHSIKRAVIEAERAAVHELFQSGAIHDTVLRRLERDLDLEELRMDA